MDSLTVILTTLNEERNIERCLESVRWADEIVVVDSFSTDRTPELARKYTERFYQHPYAGSSKQVERGIGYARSTWVFIIDGDEVMSDELAREIRGVLAEARGVAGFEILRKAYAFGKWIRYGGWYPDYQTRLFRKDSYTANHQEVHGGFRIRGERGRLEGVLHHYTYDTIFSYIAKMNDYTSLEVSNRLARNPGATVRWYNLILNPLSHFLRSFVSLRGYRDGFHGFVLALLDAIYSLILYAKLWEFRMRQAEGTGFRPPITNEDLNEAKRSR
jgi:glycosyltransferase involved in cell wall biosynthesis